jgi:hypothetical protein
VALLGDDIGDGWMLADCADIRDIERAICLEGSPSRGHDDVGDCSAVAECWDES